MQFLVNGSHNGEREWESTIGGKYALRPVNKVFYRQVYGIDRIDKVAEELTLHAILILV